MKSILTTAILASASLALLGASAQAQSTTAYNPGDIFLGFHATGGTGATTDYLLDLGSATQLENATAPITFSLGNINADLTSVYGSGYQTRTDLLVGLIAASGDSFGDVDPASSDPDNTLFVSRKHGSPVPHVLTNSTQGVTETKIGSMGSSYDSQTSTANSPVGITQATSSGNSYASFNPANNSFGLGYSIESSPISSSVLDIYRLVPATGNGPGTLLGALTFDPSTSNPTFTPNSGPAIPEPGAVWAALPLAGLLGMARRRVVRA